MVLTFERSRDGKMLWSVGVATDLPSFRAFEQRGMPISLVTAFLVIYCGLGLLFLLLMGFGHGAVGGVATCGLHRD